ncbi:MAG: hypothetical protein LBT23_10370 [Synergistaceae bacterium]|nr:hypothetical protein [Synergistaceae bacterium]
MTKKSTHLILGIGWIVLMSQPMDILMGFGQFSILSQVGMYIIMLILFGISLALTQRGGMMGYFYSLTEKFEKDDDGSSEIILSTMRPQVEKTLENSKAGKIAALVILSLLVICPLAPADVSVRAIELISYLLACFLALIVYFWIDRYVRDNLYHYLVILKNAVQNDQRFLFKSLLAKRLRRNRFFITLMFGLCVLVSILLNYEAINKW